MIKKGILDDALKLISSKNYFESIVLLTTHINKNNECNLEEKLDFIEDNYYELCISTHTIEHLLNSKQFLDEIRRISSKEILLVFPKQFSYEHTPDTHINFFPFKFEVEKLFGKIDNKQKQLIDLKYDWFYFEKL